MKIKKVLSIILSLSLAAAVFIGGCAPGNSSPETDIPGDQITDGNENGGSCGNEDNSGDNSSGGSDSAGDSGTGDNGGGNIGGDDGDNSGSGDGTEGGENAPPDDGISPQIFTSGWSNNSKVGYSAEYLGTAVRTLPETDDGGLSRYPQYGVPLSDASVEEKEAIIAENSALIAGSSTYDSMDADGNLYLGGKPTGGKLYKHTAASGMYGGDVSDDEPAVIKRITYTPRGTYGNMLTGIYAPAGEVITIELSAEDLARTGGIKVYIGQFLTNGGQNNIWSAREFNRMPMIGNAMTVSGQKGCVGSFLGGPVYIAPVRNCSSFSVTISGGVNYSHYIHGYTTREEFESNKNSSAPYFDLEVWDDSVRHSGPASRAAGFTYDELKAAAELWDKIARVSNQVPAGSDGDTGITFLYDPFIAAGSMVAFVGRHTVNCPPDVLTAALDAQSAVENASGSFWGAIHEFNHHYQCFGFHYSDEVTNNAVSIAEYSLFTRISSRRALGNAAQGNYADGWDRYTNPAWVLSQTLSNTGVNSALDSYVNLIHSFGQQTFIKATQLGGKSYGADAWYKAVSDATGYDMTYYFTDILHQTVSDGMLSQYASENNPVFVPVATIFQTGRGYISGGKTEYCRTAQPYAIRAGQPFELNFNDNIIAPEGFTVTVKSFTSPVHGALVKQEEGVYLYTPAADGASSGEMYLTLSVAKDDGAFEVEDVQLVIELHPSYSGVPVTRTTYLYEDGGMYSTATAAYEGGYAGYSSVTVADNANRVQNGNCEIWEPGYSDNAVMELSGKLYIPSDGKYRIALRGRYFAALYISLDDGQTYSLAGKIENGGHTDKYFPDDPSTYTDIELKGGQYVYFKEVLLIKGYGGYGGNSAYIGLGMGRFSGQSVTVSHVTGGLNVNYTHTPFESGYLYPRAYTFDGVEKPSLPQMLVSAKYSPWDGSYPIDNLFDDNNSNFIHSDRTPITADNPFEMTVDLGEVFRANTFTIYGEPTRKYQPKNFVLCGGLSSDDMRVLAEVNGAERTGDDIVISFSEQDIRYYKLVVTDTYDPSANKYIAFRRAEMSFVSKELAGGVQLSPDALEYNGGWSLSGRLSSFGHLYVGQKAAARFAFTGTRFGIMSFDDGFTSFEVYIDGRYTATVECGGSGKTRLVYISDALSDGEHTVELKSLGSFNIDSVIIK